MANKAVIYIGLFLGSTIGSYIPALWHQGIFSFASIIGSLIGGIVGVWVGYKISVNYL